MYKRLVAPTLLENHILATPEERKVKMPTTIMIENGPKLQMEVAEDCVVFAGRCICHQINKNAEVMIQKAKAAGKTKIVIVGDCDEHNGREGEMLQVMSAAGIECKWLYEETCFLREVMPNFSQTGIRRFAEAEDFRKLRNLLDKIGRRVWDIKQKIKHESTLLAEYPVVAQVQAIESHDHNFEYAAGEGTIVFNALFGHRANTLVSEVNSVVLFNLENKTGLIVTKSQRFDFSFANPDDFELNIFQGKGKSQLERKGYTREGCGSIRVNVGKGSTELSIYCNPGVWTVKPHPELDVTDPDVHYVPMWKRVEKVK